MAIETAPNTSASPSFNGMSNGNPGRANVSKQDLHTLLYPGSTTKIFAHMVGWFGQSNHYNVGYTSWAPAQIKSQLSDMMSRGITGVVLDWRGPNNSQDWTAAALRSEVDARGGAFQFAIMEDGGALKTCYKTSGCDVTQKFINDLNYAYSQYVSSPNYLRVNGRPAYFTFGTEKYPINWARVATGLLGNPVFMPENAGGFTLPLTSGAFAWVQPSNVTTTDPMALKYLTDFIWNANHFPALTPFLSAYKGFDDSYASWGTHRRITQSCGQTWLQTFNTVNQGYNASHPLPFLQLVTWDDYEEGTPIETGIDNCVSISGSVNAGILSWAVNGGLENTIDHYSIYISTNGSNLMKVTDVNAAQHSLNIGSYNFIHGTYSMFIKAWGKPSIVNKMSPAISAAL